MHIFIETFVRSNWIILGWTMLRAAASDSCSALPGLEFMPQGSLPCSSEGAVGFCGSWRLDFAGWYGMTMDDLCQLCKEMKEETSILYHIINISTHIICNFVNLMALYWQQRDHLVELQASIWKPRVPLGRCWFLRWGQWELPVEGKDARGIFGK